MNLQGIYGKLTENSLQEKSLCSIISKEKETRVRTAGDSLIILSFLHKREGRGIRKGKAMKRERIEEFEDCPVIAAIKDEDGLKKCLHSDIQIVFVLYGDICNISKIVAKLKAAGKTVIIHIDLIAGLSSKEIAVTYIKSVTHADGIISTRPAVIREAKEEGLFAIMRFFVIDSIAFDSIQRQTESVRPDMIEVLPGVMPKVIRRICRESRVPVIAGGLIADKEDIMAALDAGAVSISTTRQDVWFM